MNNNIINEIEEILEQDISHRQKVLIIENIIKEHKKWEHKQQ